MDVAGGDTFIFGPLDIDVLIIFVVEFSWVGEGTAAGDKIADSVTSDATLTVTGFGVEMLIGAEMDGTDGDTLILWP